MGLFLSFRDSTVLCLPDWEPGGPCRGRVSPLKFPPTSTFAWGLFLRKAAVGVGVGSVQVQEPRLRLLLFPGAAPGEKGETLR